MKHSRLTIAIFVSLILGIIAGWAFPDFAVKTHVLAEIFLRMVKMIIAPLLFATLVVGIAGHGDVKSLGRLGVKTVAYFEIVTTFALAIGLGFANLFKPGEGMVDVASQQIRLNEIASNMASATSHNSFGEMLLDLFPTSIVQSMADGNLLQIVVFSIFFALAICAIGKKAQPVLDILNSVSSIMFKFTEYVMMFAPMGIFGAIAYTVGSNGIEILYNYGKIILSLYVALAVFVIIVLLAACKIVKISFRGLIKAIQEPALLTFTTASSEAALPKAMSIMEKFGVPKSIVSFVMPTGYTFNLDGSTLYLAMAVLFSTQLVGIHLTLDQQLVIMFALMLTSKGVAGVPRASLIVLAGTLTSFNYPILGVAILLGIDQILDMGRTTVNLIGNCVATVVIARWENCFDYNKMNEFLKRKNIKINTLGKTNGNVSFQNDFGG
ncbi:MAG: cation:dicarboxylase symporter family transporter [Candidatus Gastranaerophilales bacterium]|nr:cation:dicarboxylase symporter family transporter [Candidatus Gastranaerophilales bacterium]MCM1073831.1 cation:dicarboxylase symporter family transporter [Bacteroides sp.]